MAPGPSVIYEYDPATGMTVPRDANELFMEDNVPAPPPAPAEPAPTWLQGRRQRRSMAAGAPPHGAMAKSAGAPPPLRPAPVTGESASNRKLSASGKDKVRRYVAQASSLEELAEIDTALDTGRLSDGLASKLRLTDADFEAPPRPAAAAATTEAAAPPIATLSLTPSGLLKVKQSIADAEDMELLVVLDRALKQGDITRLRDMLDLQPEDLQGGDEDLTEEEASEVTDEGSESEDEDYDPFATEPTQPGESAKKRGRRAGVLGELQGAYSEGESEERAAASKPARKKRKGAEEKGKVLSWPIGWAWLVSRTQRHPDFRAPIVEAGTLRAKDPEAQDGENVPAAQMQHTAVAVATSLVYVGDATNGYDPRHLARVSAVSDKGEVLLDVLVRPRQKLLDARTHLTGLKKAQITGKDALDYDEACARLLALLAPKTLLVGYRMSACLEALKLWHEPIVDVSLVFGVESRKQHQYHPLRNLAEKFLLEEPDDGRPHDALEVARQCMALARREAMQPTATPPFPLMQKASAEWELQVRHIPREWGAQASARIHALAQGARQKPVVQWLLSEVDPTDWRGESVLTFPSKEVRDAAFDKVKGLTDVHVQWEDAPGAPPLGAFLTEQSLMQGFATEGEVVAARIPRKPITREPYNFAFISFLNREDAARVGKQQRVKVQITPTWSLSLKPRLAKFGHETDKRVAVRLGDDDPDALDWVHVTRR